MMQELKIDIEDHQPLAILTLTGFFAASEVYKLKSLAEGLLREGSKYVVLNLAAVDYVDSAGLGVLMQVWQNCQKNSGILCVVRPDSSQVQRVIEISALARAIHFFDSVNLALELIQTRFGLFLSDKAPVAISSDLKDVIKSLVHRIGTIEERLSRIETHLGIQ